MRDFARTLGATKAASTLLVLFIPSKDRGDQPIDQEYWVNEALAALELWVAEAEDGVSAGFIGLSDAKVEMLFVDPAWHRHGIGRTLLLHAADPPRRRRGRAHRLRDRALTSVRPLADLATLGVAGWSSGSSLGS